MKKRIGAFAGKFLPPHVGHVLQIQKCSEKVDKLIVVVSENKEHTKKLCLDAGLPEMPVKLRIKWLRKYFKYNKKIKIAYLNEKGIPAFPNGMKEWSDRFKKKFKNVNVKFADATYRELNEKYFPECEFIEFDREDNPMSATMIRQNPLMHKNLIITPAQSFVLKNFKQKNNNDN